MVSIRAIRCGLGNANRTTNRLEKFCWYKLAVVLFFALSRNKLGVSFFRYFFGPRTVLQLAYRNLVSISWLVRATCSKLLPSA